jgi:predicted dehydrogenase
MRAAGGFEVVAVVDRDADRARRVAKLAGIGRHAAAASADELPFLDEIDAVTCGTAPFSHYSIVRSAIETGKHVLTEKPFTMTVQEGEELLALARAHPTTVAVIHNFQFMRSALQVKRWIRQGRLGTIRAIWGFQLSNPRRRLPTWREELPLGLFYDEAPHLFYTTRAFGEPRNLQPVSATVRPSTIGDLNTPAQVDVQLELGEIPVTLAMNFEAPLSEWHILVLGDRGTGSMDLFRDIAAYVPNDRGHRGLDVFRSSAASTFAHWRGYARSGVGHLRKSLLYGNVEVFHRFAEAARTGAELHEMGPDDALAVVKLQHAVVDAAGGRNRLMSGDAPSHETL